MSQWYPKLAEYDYQGWHANPYVGREFYGIWGDFDVKITIDSRLCRSAGRAICRTRKKLGSAMSESGNMESGSQADTKTYHFIAPNVHDFMWGADPDFMHI